MPFAGLWGFSTWVNEFPEGMFTASVDADEFGVILGEPAKSRLQAIASALRAVAKILEEAL